jgi:hypothetical protein
MIDPPTPTTPADDHAEAAAERERLTYEGHRLPVAVILVWAAFLLFGLAYFLRHI